MRHSPRRIRVSLRTKIPFRAGLLSAVGIASAAVGLTLYATGALYSLQLTSIDYRFNVRGSQPPKDDIVIVGLDAKSIETFGDRPPIPRIYYAQLLDRLHLAHPRLIALDTLFAGATDHLDDASLLAATYQARPVLFAEHQTSAGPTPVANVKNARGAVLASASLEQNLDGILREMTYRSFHSVTFAVRAAEMVTDRTVSSANFPNNSAWIDYRGPEGTFPTYSFAGVVDKRIPISTFRNKIVLVGATDPAQKDIYLTPTSQVPMSGVEIWANQLWTILNGFPLRPVADPYTVLLILAFAGIPPLLATRFSGLFIIVASFAIIAIYLLIAQIAFNSGRIVDIPCPIVALGLACVGTVAAESFLEHRERRALEQAIGPLYEKGAHFFISYRRTQSRWPAKILAAALQKRFGPSCVFLDSESLEAGERWPQRIEDAVNSCAVVFVLIGPDWLSVRKEDGTRRIDDPDDWVRKETATALGRFGVVVVPVLLDGAAMPSEGDLPDALKPLLDCQYVALIGDDIEVEIDRLIESVQRSKRREFLKQLPTQVHT
jgi:CHASE2 domain-containing sensor protein